MKKNVMVKILAMMMALCLLAVGCGGKDSAASGSSNGNGSSAAQPPDPAKVADAMLAAITPRGELPVMEETVVDNFYSFDKGVLSSYKIYASTTYTAEEIAVFAAPNEDAVKAAEKAIDTRIDDLKTSFDGYKPEELAVMEENTRVLKADGVVCLLIGDKDNVEKAQKAFAEAVK